MKPSTLLSSITSKLSLLMGGTLLVTGAQAAVPTQPQLTLLKDGVSVDADAKLNLPAQLILKQKQGGFRLIAEHGSHSSHTSHGSHGSHSSHSSRAS